jgi:hypothetical protein
MAWLRVIQPLAIPSPVTMTQKPSIFSGHESGAGLDQATGHQHVHPPSSAHTTDNRDKQRTHNRQQRQQTTETRAGHQHVHVT